MVTAVVLFGFVTISTTSSKEVIQEDQKYIPIKGVEKSGYTDSNEASI